MSSTAPPDDPTPEELARTATPATLRRAPRYRGFVVAGMLVGVLAAVVAVAVTGPAREGAALDTVSVLLLLAVILAGFGALLGAGVAVVVDRRSLRASRRAAAGDDAASSA